MWKLKLLSFLCFQEEISRICDYIPSKCQFHLTKEKESVPASENCRNFAFSREKITEESIQKVISAYEPRATDCYLCGPPLFIDKMKTHLLNLGCLEENIFYEKWW